MRLCCYLLKNVLVVVESWRMKGYGGWTGFNYHFTVLGIHQVDNYDNELY